MKQETVLITRFISVWAWQILAALFLLRTVSFLFLKEYAWVIGFAGAMFICLFMAFKRKQEIIQITKEVKNDPD